MYFKTRGFRALYNHFTVFELTDDLRPAVEPFPCSDEADCFLTYGYVDHEQGLILEVIAAGLYSGTGLRDFIEYDFVRSMTRVNDPDDDGSVLVEDTGHEFRFFRSNDTVRSMLPITSIEEKGFILLQDMEKRLQRMYPQKIETLRKFDCSEDIMKTRKDARLDQCRHPIFVDDVNVLFMRNGRKPEHCRVRITGIEEPCYRGTLMVEPEQDFGAHAGDTVSFIVCKEQESKMIRFSAVYTVAD